MTPHTQPGVPICCLTTCVPISECLQLITYHATWIAFQDSQCITAVLTSDSVQAAGQGFGRGSKKGPGRHSAGGGRGGHSKRVAPYQAPHVSHQPPTAHKFQVRHLPFRKPSLRCVISALTCYIVRGDFGSEWVVTVTTGLSHALAPRVTEQPPQWSLSPVLLSLKTWTPGR